MQEDTHTCTTHEREGGGEERGRMWEGKRKERGRGRETSEPRKHLLSKMMMIARTAVGSKTSFGLIVSILSFQEIEVCRIYNNSHYTHV